MAQRTASRWHSYIGESAWMVIKRKIMKLSLPQVYDLYPYNNVLDYMDRCEEERWLALATKNESGIPMFVPVCKEDGSYADVQCHYKTGYCWCVNHEGVPIPDTSVKYDRPDCAKSKFIVYCTVYANAVYGKH